MRLSELRRLSHSHVAVYKYEKTIKLSELRDNYQYPKYCQVKNKETVDIYCISMLEDCIVDDIEAVDNAIIALTHNDDYNCLR